MTLAQAIQILTIIGLMAMMVSMGLGVSLSQIVGTWKRPWLVCSGLAVNFAVVPLATVFLLQFFEAQAMVSVGFLILAVCPGAPVSPAFSAIARGDNAVAVGQMVLLAGLSAILAPLLLSQLLPRLLPDSSLAVDFLAIVRTLLFSQMVPLAVGLAGSWRAPQIASRLSKPLGALANLLLLAAVALILVREFPALEAIRLRGWFGMLLLAAVSFLSGWIGGGRNRPIQKSFALTAMIRNVAVALVIVSANFPNTPAVTAVIAYALVSILVGLCCAFALAKLPATG